MGRIRRRQFLVATSALLAARLSHAQQPQRLWKIGFLDSGHPTSSRARLFLGKGIPEALKQRGLEQVRNLAIDTRFAKGDIGQLDSLAVDLVRQKVDLIVTIGNAAALAAKKATRTIPIVMATSGSPVEAGLVESYARPGGNITGIDWVPQTEVYQKWYQILKAAVPGAKRVTALHIPPPPKLAHLYGDEYHRKVTAATGLTIAFVEMQRPEELAGALEKVAASRPDVLGCFLDNTYYRSVAEFATKQRLVSIGGTGYTADGGLLMHTPHVPTMTDRIASYVERILLHGAKPADLPVERPSKFELVLNMKTAKAMGLTLPPSFMLQVDRTIE